MTTKMASGPVLAARRMTATDRAAARRLHLVGCDETGEDPPRPPGLPTPRTGPGRAERRQYYVAVLCEDGYEHEFLVSEILNLFTGRARGAYSPLCRRPAQPETRPNRQVRARCIDCRRIRSTITPEPVWWGDPRPLLQALADYFIHYNGPTEE